MPNVYEVRTFNSSGVQERIISGARLEFTDELGAEGYVKVSLTRGQAIAQGLSHRTEVAVFLNGVELDGSRAFLVETTGNPSSGPDLAGEGSDAVWGGRTLHAGVKGINTYPMVFPVLTGSPKNWVFKDKTPGFILKSLLDAARARGAASDIEYTTWNSLTDSNGVGWDKALNLEYKPGVDLKTIIENMIRLGAIEFRYSGRELKVYNGETFGMDWTTGAAPICLYKGREVADAPYSESSDEVVNALLVMGDDGVLVEKVDTDSVALYGRREGTLSQGGTKDLGMLNFLGDTTLATSARLRGEYTVRVLSMDTGPQPFTDYRVGDWILYDRIAGQPPEKFRVRQISVTSDGDSQSIVITLNDKFAELDLRTSKKVEGIIGGAAMEGSTPVSSSDPDTLDPSPPTAVGTASQSYAEPSGVTRSVAISSWAAPTTNVDGSPLTDLVGYDVEHRTTPNVAYAANTAWYPAITDNRLQARWDRRGKDTSNTWVGADGGASVRAADGDDWFFWSDTNWGRMAQNGSLIEWNSMPRSSITKSDPTTLNEMRAYVGRRNLLPDAISCTSSITGWASNGSPAISTGFGPSGTALRILTGSKYASYSKAAPVKAGLQYLIEVKTRADSGSPVMQYRFQNDAGAFVAAVVNVTANSDGWARAYATAPSTATFVQVAFTSPAAATWTDASYFGVYETESALQTWQPQTHSEVFYNEISNPDGAGGTASTAADTLAFTNLSSNPSALVNDSVWSVYGGATKARLADPQAWDGVHLIRITNGTDATSLAAMHYPIPISANTGYVARARVRGTAGRTLYGTIANYNGGSGVSGGGASSPTITLSGQWQEIIFPASVGASTANNLGLQFIRSGTWLTGDYFEVDGVEIYQGSTLAPFYFDGSTVTPAGYRSAWTGTVGASTSTLYLTPEVDRNWVANPRVWNNLTDYLAYGTGTTITRTNSQAPGKVGGRWPVPEVINPAGLNTWLADFAAAGTKSVGIGVVGDSTAESTGHGNNPDLSDRFIERLQALLRRDSAVPGVPINPKGYYGGSAYIAASFNHAGPVDWNFVTADPDKFPLANAQSAFGAGGRFRNINAGHSANFTAVFDRVKIFYGRSADGRKLRISIDGVQQTLINTYVDHPAADTQSWTSPVLPSGEHVVVCEFVPVDGWNHPSGPSQGLPTGSVTLMGAEIFNGDYDKGVRVYDLSESGKAAYDVASRPREMDDDFKPRSLSLLIIKLGFNDAGRQPPWPGGTRSSAAFKADVQSIISGARSRGFTGSVLLVGQWQASQLTTTEAQANYRTRLREIANADSKVSFIDLSTVMPDTVGDTTGMYVDGLHPSTKGMERIADALYNTVTPTPAGEASVQTITSGSVALAGLTIRTPGHATPWAVGTLYNAGVWFKGTAGKQMVLRTLCDGNGGDTLNFTATGQWQFVVSRTFVVESGATTAPYAIVRTAAADKTVFWVGRTIISQTPITGYFDGEISKDGHTSRWLGTAYASQSALALKNPTLITVTSSVSGSRYYFDPNEYVQGQGSACAQASQSGGSYLAISHTIPLPVTSGRQVTVIAMVKADFQLTNTLLRPRNNGTYIGGTAATPVTAAPGEWFEVRWSGTLDNTANNLILVAYGAIPAGGRVWMSEATVVATDGFYYRGTPFHGGQGGQGVTTEWMGAPHASRSKVTLYNSSSAPTLTQAGSIFHPAAAGGNISEYVWVTGAVKSATADKAYVFCNGMRNRALRGDGWNFQRNGTVYIAEFDLTTTSLSRWVMWFDDPNVQWGDAAVVDGSYLYIFGTGGNDGLGKTYLMRTSATDPIGGTRQFWNGSTWAATPASAAPVATSSAGGGFSGVRKFNGKWIAVHVGGYMNQMDGYEAPAPQGPWTRIGAVHRFAEKSDFSIKYSARFHPQLDSAEDGIAISYSEAGQNGNETYGVKFVRGPKGVTSPQFTANDGWTPHPMVETSPDSYSPLNPGWAYQVRVRSRDENDRVSTWALGAPILLNGDTTAPPKPAKPIATSFFRGARIEVSGLTAAGGAYPPDFSHLTIHQSTTEDFAPSDANLIDTLTTRGGIVVSSGLKWGVAYFWKVVAWDRTGNQSEASEATTALAERLSDPDLPEKLIDGAKHIKEESLSVKNFSVGAFGNSLVPNGNMEEHVAGSELPTGWTKGWPLGTSPDWDAAATFSTDYSNPIAGSKSIKITTKIASSRQLVSPIFPLTPGDVYYVKAKVRTSRKLGDSFIEAGLDMGDAIETVNKFGTASSVNATAGVSDGSEGGGSVTIEGQVEVPDFFGDGTGNAMRFGAFSLRAWHDGNASYDVWVDDVEVRQIVGSAAIANASINRAKIRFLAVDDARISSLGVGKLIAGELWADITVSARIMTAKTGQRVEMNREGLFGYNGTDIEPVTEVRADNGGLVSRWFRTNTVGTRIEMGTYGQAMGADAALMAFFPAAGNWQFPPAFGFGGESRRPRWPGESAKVPGLAVHAGSFTSTLYDKHGMNMISVDQVGGIVGVTGGKLDTSEASDGAPIRFNAGGSKGYIELLSGGVNSTDPARLVLDPDAEASYLALNKGGVRFANVGAGDSYRMEFVSGDTWLGYNHLHIQIGGGGLRVSSTANPNAFIFKSNDLTVSNGEVYANSFVGSNNTAAVLRTTGGRGLRFDNRGNPYAFNTGDTRAHNAFYINDAGMIDGGGDWGTPKIKVRGQDSYISWDPNGNAYLNGSQVKTFVIPHPTDKDKFLVHAAHEGDEMRVVYEGTESVRGARTLQLPGYFEALVESGSDVVFVQALADVDRPLCECNVRATRVEGGRFGVFVIPDEWCKGEREHEVEFSWRVTAIRAGTAFETEPSVADTVVRGDGPYTYIM